MSASFSDVSGTVVALHICPGHRKPMVRVVEITAQENHGLTGDRHANKGSSRQVLLVEQEVLADLGLLPGIVKENITTEGLRLMQVPQGTRVIIGDSVMLELTKPCTPCSRMDEIRPGLRRELDGRRGMLARVVSGGTIQEGDRILIVDEEP